MLFEVTFEHGFNDSEPAMDFAKPEDFPDYVYGVEADTEESARKIAEMYVGVETHAFEWIGEIKSIVQNPNSKAELLQIYFRHININSTFLNTVSNITVSFWAYGNKNISGAIDSFWLNNKLKISPDEQLGLLKKLYFDQLPFRKSVQQIVRNVMLQEDNTLYKLSYKTGWGFDESKNNIGWVTGWIEENRHVYFFVTIVKSPDPKIDMKTVRMDITKDILKQYGFLEGKK